jgi:hypothetical protein
MRPLNNHLLISVLKNSFFLKFSAFEVGWTNWTPKLMMNDKREYRNGMERIGGSAQLDRETFAQLVTASDRLNQFYS